MTRRDINVIKNGIYISTINFKDGFGKNFEKDTQFRVVQVLERHVQMENVDDGQDYYISYEYFKYHMNLLTTITIEHELNRKEKELFL